MDKPHDEKNKVTIGWNLSWTKKKSKNNKQENKFNQNTWESQIEKGL